MKHALKSAMLGVLGPAVLAGCALPPAGDGAAQAQPTAVQGKDLLPLEMRLARAVQGVKDLRALATGVPVVCDAAVSSCVVPLTVHLLPPDPADPTGYRHCVVEVPARVGIKGSGPGKPKVDIVWRLETSVPTSTTRFEFQKDFGILLVVDKFPPGQLNKLGRGSGPGGPQQFTYENKRHNVGDEAAYYPLVLQFPASGKEALCAAIDPIIINEQ